MLVSHNEREKSQYTVGSCRFDVRSAVDSCEMAGEDIDPPVVLGPSEQRTLDDGAVLSVMGR